MTPRSATKSGRWFRASADACRTCPLRERCLPDGSATRRVHITGTYVDVLRARRKRLAWAAHETRLYCRHRWLVEGAHGLAKSLDGMARAARRGLENLKIQALLTATAINLKRLAKAILLAVIQAYLTARNEEPNTAQRKRSTTYTNGPRWLMFQMGGVGPCDI